LTIKIFTLYSVNCKYTDLKKARRKALPTHKSAKKRIKTSGKSNTRNRAVKSRIRTLVKNAEASVDEASLKEAVSILDRAARKKVIHPNKASRMKSRLAKAVHKKAAPATT